MTSPLSIISPEIENDPLGHDRFHPMRHLMRGIRELGDECEATTHPPRLLHDIAIGWGPKHQGLGLCWARRWLCIELGFLKPRFENNFLGFDGLNGRGRWPIMPGREESWLHLLKPYRVPPEIRRVLVFGQVPTDFSLQGLDDGRGIRYLEWLNRLIRSLRAMGYEVRFRKHPLATDRLDVTVQTAEGTLDEAVEWADLCVAYSSNALLDAFLLGCPVAPFSETSMTWPVRSSLREIRTVSHDERVRWLLKVASSQWSQREMLDGTAWRALREFHLK